MEKQQEDLKEIQDQKLKVYSKELLSILEKRKEIQVGSLKDDLILLFNMKHD